MDYDIFPYICMDIGGTLSKMIIAARPQTKINVDVISRLTIVNNVLGYNIYFTSFQNSMNTLFKILNDLEIKDKVLKFYITGGGAFKYQDELQQIAPVIKIQEFDALKKGFLFLDQYKVPKAYFVQPHSQVKEYINLHETIYPFLLVNIGSGVSILKFDSKQEFSRISGTSLGGGMFLGLCHLFTGNNNFDELLQMSTQGSNAETDLLMNEMQLGFDSPTKDKNEQYVAVSMGKVRKDKKNQKTSQEDLVKSLLYMTTYNISQIAFMHSKLENIDRVFFSGHFIRNHNETLECISEAFQYFSHIDGHHRNPYFISHDGFIGAIGSFVTALEDNKFL